MMRGRWAVLVGAAALASSGCSWVEQQVKDRVYGGSVQGDETVPGLTVGAAKERIAGYLQESLRGLPEGVFYASYARDALPGQAGFTRGASIKLYDGPEQKSPFMFSIDYWVHFPEGSGTAEEWFDRAAVFWSTRMRPIKPPEVAATAYLRYTAFFTPDNYSVGLVVNKNHDFSIGMTSPRYAYAEKDPTDAMPETITRNGYSASGEPPK